MAQQKRVELIDDLDGAAADETISFGLDGASYEIDLSETNATELRANMTEFLAHARRVGRHTTTTNRTQKTSQAGLTTREERERTQSIRTWARAAGYTVSDRGRIPATIIEAYDRAH